MNKYRTLTICSVAVIGLVTSGLARAANPAQDAVLQQTFDLSGERSVEVQFFEMESRLIVYALDGKRVGGDVFRLRLKGVPARLSGKQADEYTCVEFTVQTGDAAPVPIPALAGWTYLFGTTPEGIDEKGQVFGIDHAKFAKLVDAEGKVLPPDKSYHVYNAFIDFHSFCDVFARPVPAGGKGIQDLKRIGDKIVHAAAFSEPPVGLGSDAANGSAFKNGKITLELKGLSRVDGAACALVAYDSGESSFRMIAKPTPEMEIRSVGSSHYLGDLYIDLATRWVRRATMYEMVVAETTLPTAPHKVNAVIERDILIRNVGQDGFARR
ncbi:MAG: hypothetical protein JW741_07880 [Sedimentisphaerales bacterium]|nr:hypothetical protein [Sedimentisphaerales bacterium]